MSTEPILKFGVPKGSLEEATQDLFARAGWKISRHERNYFPDVNDPELQLSLTRVQEIGGLVADGILDAGIAARDWIREMDLEDKLVKVCDLVYAKTSLRPSRWVLAVAGDSGSLKTWLASALPLRCRISPGVTSGKRALTSTFFIPGVPRKPRSFRGWPTVSSK